MLTSKEVEDFITKIYNLRKIGIARGGEFDISNLVFKEFRNLGYLDRLKDLRKELKGKELSLEHLDEEFLDEKLKKNNTRQLLINLLKTNNVEDIDDGVYTFGIVSSVTSKNKDDNYNQALKILQAEKWLDCDGAWIDDSGTIQYEKSNILKEVSTSHIIKLGLALKQEEVIWFSISKSGNTYKLDARRYGNVDNKFTRYLKIKSTNEVALDNQILSKDGFTQLKYNNFKFSFSLYGREYNLNESAHFSVAGVKILKRENDYAVVLLDNPTPEYLIFINKDLFSRDTFTFTQDVFSSDPLNLANCYLLSNDEFNNLDDLLSKAQENGFLDLDLRDGRSQFLDKLKSITFKDFKTLNIDSYIYSYLPNLEKVNFVNVDMLGIEDAYVNGTSIISKLTNELGVYLYFDYSFKDSINHIASDNKMKPWYASSRIKKTSDKIYFLENGEYVSFATSYLDLKSNKQSSKELKKKAISNNYNKVVYRVTEYYPSDDRDLNDFEWKYSRGLFFSDDLNYYKDSNYQQQLPGYSMGKAIKYYMNMVDFRVFNIFEQYNTLWNVDRDNHIDTNVEIIVNAWDGIYIRYDLLEGLNLLDLTQNPHYNYYREVNGVKYFNFSTSDIGRSIGKQHRYDILILKDIPHSRSGNKYTEYIVYNSNCVKLANETKNDNDEVISIDNRFNKDSYDIRESNKY